MTEPDDARIERLTALARKVWHHEEEQPVTVERGLRGCDPATAFVRTGNGIALDIAAPNDRALEALEAALLVLALPERGVESAKSVLDLCRANTELGMALIERDQRITELEAQLAKVDVCEVCGDCLEPQPVRCEKHVHTERGDPEWTYQPEGT